MANKLYPEAKENILRGEIALHSDTIKCSLLTATYTYSATHEFHSSLAGIIATQTLAGVTVADGVLDANDITWTGASLGTGNTITQAVIWKDTGVSATSPLIVHIDSGRGLPFTTAGVDQLMEWDNGGDKIFAL